MARHWIGRPLVPALSTAVVLAAAAVLVYLFHGHPGARTTARSAGGTRPAPSSASTPDPSAAPDPSVTHRPVPTSDRPSSRAPRRTAGRPGTGRAPARTAEPTESARPTDRAQPTDHSRPAGLPLDEPTGAATEVVTVVAPSAASDTATLQAWTRHGSAWSPSTGPIAAHVGTDGLTTHPSESRSATPIGSFSLTRAFGADSDPGTALPYLQTNPSDWWISQPGPLYNTHQRCSSGCTFTQGAPNEHLYAERPSYNYGVVIDYNTPNAGPVVQGAGSAFFLHVYAGIPSAGCVSIPQDDLVSILRWLKPADHPRILIGVGGPTR